jgi:SNF2 family DNA or RNA helicase
VPATKLDVLVDLVGDVAAEGHRVLVFSQFTRFLRSARERLTVAGIDTCYLDGTTRRRAEVVEEFRTGSAPVFLISLKAGGTGLTLTEADYCIVLDPWWNPATESQAVDRAHRIGQGRPVVVYRLVARDTIEEKVMELKAAKAGLFASALDGLELAAAGLTPDDVRHLVG